jgi:Fic-DOC domain mobile mystery protein B
MTDLFHEPDDATPLAPAEREGLRQSWITNRRDLNEAEQENIVKGAVWARRRRGTAALDLLNDSFVLELHKRMLGDVWKWAGHYRQTERNLGIEPHRIAPEVRAVLDDVRYWIEHKTYLPDEIAVQLHHRLVVIHPFTNGNGRHSRLMADLLIEKLGRPAFSWGSASLTEESELRSRYIAALKTADRHDIAPLLAFARS